MIPRKCIIWVFLNDEISSRIVTLLRMCSSASILDTALDKSLTTMPSLTTTTAYQLHLLQDSNTWHTLVLQFPNPKWTNRKGNRESKFPFITLPLVVLAEVWSSSRAVLIYANNGKLEIISLLKIVGKHQPQNILNTNLFENEIFLNENFPDYGASYLGMGQVQNGRLYIRYMSSS